MNLSYIIKKLQRAILQTGLPVTEKGFALIQLQGYFKGAPVKVQCRSGRIIMKPVQ